MLRHSIGSVGDELMDGYIPMAEEAAPAGTGAEGTAVAGTTAAAEGTAATKGATSAVDSAVSHLYLLFLLLYDLLNAKWAQPTPPPPPPSTPPPPQPSPIDKKIK